MSLYTRAFNLKHFDYFNQIVFLAKSYIKGGMLTINSI